MVMEARINGHGSKDKWSGKLTSFVFSSVWQIAGIHESVKRGNRIRVRYLDENLEEHDEVVEGYLARVMQHEFDHLEGKMFIDHLSPLRRQMLRGKLNAMLQGKAHCTYKVKTLRK